MAKILFIFDEHSILMTEMAGPAAEAVLAINAGKLPGGIALPNRPSGAGRLAAFQVGELVLVTWQIAREGSPEPAGFFPLIPWPAETPLPVLTQREREVLQLLTDGLTVKQIADRLHLNSRTIRYYVNSVNTKFGTQSTEQSVGKGIIMGLCKLPPFPSASPEKPGNEP